MRILIATSVVSIIVLAGCKKNAPQIDVKLQAFCAGCAIEWSSGNGIAGRDTMYGTVVYGSGTIDTIPDWTSGYNIVIQSGDQPMIKACPLEGFVTPISVRATGGIVRYHEADSALCAEIHD